MLDAKSRHNGQSERRPSSETADTVFEAKRTGLARSLFAILQPRHARAASVNAEAVFSCALGNAVGLVYVWAFARALASSLARAYTGTGSRGDHWTAAFVCSVVGGSAGLLALTSRDTPVGFVDFVDVVLATAAGAAVMLYVWSHTWIRSTLRSGHR